MNDLLVIGAIVLIVCYASKAGKGKPCGCHQTASSPAAPAGEQPLPPFDAGDAEPAAAVTTYEQLCEAPS